MNETTAPTATTTPRPESWGSIFDPQEFADYMAGKYDTPAPARIALDYALEVIEDTGFTVATVNAAHAAAEQFLTTLDGKGILTVPTGALIVCLESFTEGDENSAHFRNHYGNALARFKSASE